MFIVLLYYPRVDSILRLDLNSASIYHFWLIFWQRRRVFQSQKRSCFFEAESERFVAHIGRELNYFLAALTATIPFNATKEWRNINNP